MRAAIAAIVLALGQPSPKCEFIQDHDARNFCRAETSHDATYCEFILDAGLKRRCRATAR